MSDEINPNVEPPADAEALADKQETPVEPVVTEEASLEVSEPVPESEISPEPQTAQMAPIEPLAEPARSGFSYQIRDLLTQAQDAIQGRKRKKLDKIMTMFEKKSKITNDEVEKLLHVSDATATRYLSILKKEGRIQQNGKTGKGVSYSKI